MAMLQPSEANRLQRTAPRPLCGVVRLEKMCFRRGVELFFRGKGFVIGDGKDCDSSVVEWSVAHRDPPVTRTLRPLSEYGMVSRYRRYGGMFYSSTSDLLDKSDRTEGLTIGVRDASDPSSSVDASRSRLASDQRAFQTLPSLGINRPCRQSWS